jgi:hypothetical protein
MATVTFRDYQRALLIPAIADPVGQDWATAFGLLKDGVAEGFLECARVGNIRTAPSDALPYHGADRKLERGPGEDDLTYAIRLENAWESYKWAGTDKAVLDALAILKLTAHIKRNNQWDWDGHPGNVTGYWARMWPVITAPSSWTGPAICGGGGVCGTGLMCGITGATVDQIQFIRRVVLKWTGSHALIPQIIVLLGGAHLCGDGGVCGAGLVCGTGAAAYLEGW